MSDILDRLIDIDGVISVDNLLLTAYDASGNPITGIADPDWTNGTPAFDPDRISAAVAAVPAAPTTGRGCTAGCRGSCSRATACRSCPASTRPRTPSCSSTGRPRGRSSAPPSSTCRCRWAAPRALEAYYPVQHSFPLTYGIGPAGLPSTATAQRRAQAKQLKAYLMVYEQLLRNAYAQVAHVGDLFSLDPAIEQTYFVGLFDDAPIAGYDEIVDAGPRSTAGCSSWSRPAPSSSSAATDSWTICWPGSARASATTRWCSPTSKARARRARS